MTGWVWDWWGQPGQVCRAGHVRRVRLFYRHDDRDVVISTDTRKSPMVLGSSCRQIERGLGDGFVDWGGWGC